MAGFFSFLAAIFQFFANKSAAKRDEALRNEGKTEAQKETAEANIQEIKERIEAANEGNDKPYDGDPSVVREWLRRKRESDNQ